MPPLRASPSLSLVLLALCCGLGLYLMSGPAAEAGGEALFPDEHDRDVPLPSRPETIAAGADAASLRRVGLQIEQLAQLLPARRPRPLVRLGPTGPVGEYVAGSLSNAFSRGRRGPQLLRFAWGHAQLQYRELRLPSEGDLELELGPEETCAGQVLDHLGQPLRDAEVWLAGQRARSDAEGRFSLAAQPVAGGLPLVVRHPEHATHYRLLSAQAYRSLRNRQIRLQQGSSLRLRVMGAGPETEVLLLPPPERQLGLLAYPFFMQALEPLRPDQDGMLELRGLPRRGSLRLGLRAASLAPFAPKAVQLRGGSQSLVLHPRRTGSVRLQIVDEQGAPRRGVVATLRPAAARVALQNAGWLLPGAAYLPELYTDRSDALGWLNLPRPEVEGLVLNLEDPQLGLEYPLSGTQLQPRYQLPLELADLGRPALLLRAARDHDCRLQVREGAQLNRYLWPAGADFSLPLRHRGLYRLALEQAGAAPAERLLMVTGPTPLPVGSH